MGNESPFNNSARTGRQLRYPRIAFSAVCGLVCLLLIVLWVRSHTTRDLAWWPGHDFAMEINSLSGHVVLVIVSRQSFGEFGPPRIEHTVVVAGRTHSFKDNFIGFGVARNDVLLRLDIPFWFLVLSGMAIAAIPWACQEWRFSLRSLLIGFTLVAVLIGGVLWAIRTAVPT